MEPLYLNVTVTGPIFSLFIHNKGSDSDWTLNIFRFRPWYGVCLLLPTAREGNVSRSMRHSVHRVGLYPKGGGLCPQGGDRCSGGSGYPLVLTSSVGHCSGQHASYWNAFLHSYRNKLLKSTFPRYMHGLYFLCTKYLVVCQ